MSNKWWNMEALNRLFAEKNAFRNDQQAGELYLRSMQEAFAFHHDHCDAYREICRRERMTPDDLRSEADLVRIPHIMVNAFKWHTLQSIPDDQIAREFTSSGTSGQKSHILWDAPSMERQGLMRRRIMETLGLVDEEPVNYLIFAYAPEVSGSKGAAYAQRMYASFAPARHTAFAITGNDKGLPVFDRDRVIETLQQYEREKRPVRLIGFPAFLHEIMELMLERNIHLVFSPRSLVITAGGWKDREAKKIPPGQFREELAQVFGLQGDRIRDVYGFVEHGVPYISCRRGHFHLPLYSRALIRRPGTLELLGYGQKGLLQLLSPYNLAQPSLSVLSTDYAALHKNCGCGIETDYIELLGRAGVAKHQGCAMTAAELLK
jgi:phenylacetate-coenzyme A ligase PaaK-like adenylate-forming protein